MHGNIFKKRSWNELFGNLMLWLNGGCYYGFRALTEQHIAHHTERADVLTFDVPDEIKKQSKFIQSLIACSEWCYFPAVAFWVRWFKITAPWRDPEQESNRMRVGILVLVRASAFGLLIFFSVKAAFIYFLAYIGMITTLRFMDAFQHTYESFPPGSQLPKRDFFYEQNNTFSNLLSQKNKWLNLIFLGFGYHNAHHAVMTCPWHSLDQLNQELCSHEYVNYISFLEQLKNYHNFRVTRLFEGQGTAVKKSESWNFSYFHGSFDVSFITLY
jgi:fatty acid desaturase